MRQVTIALVLGMLGFGLFVTAMAMAAPSQPAAIPLVGVNPLYDDPITDTDTYSPTTTHPVASAIADHFEVEYSEIAGLHNEDGLGFGVISHAYFIAETLGISPTALIEQFQSGMGWGEILKDHSLHPGLAGRGGNLGSIMSSRNKNGENWMPPGQLKKYELDDDAFVPPGQLKKSDEDNDSGDDRGGPPSVPPGQERVKDKAKGKDKK